LEEVGKSLRPGQTVRFVYTRGSPRVHAWDLPRPLDPRSLDTHRYVELLLRAVETVLMPLGFSRRELDEWVSENVQSVPLWSNELSIDEKQPLTNMAFTTATLLQPE